MAPCPSTRRDQRTLNSRRQRCRSGSRRPSRSRRLPIAGQGLVRIAVAQRAGHVGEASREGEGMTRYGDASSGRAGTAAASARSGPSTRRRRRARRSREGGPPSSASAAGWRRRPSGAPPGAWPADPAVAARIRASSSRRHAGDRELASRRWPPRSRASPPPTSARSPRPQGLAGPTTPRSSPPPLPARGGAGGRGPRERRRKDVREPARHLAPAASVMGHVPGAAPAPAGRASGSAPEERKASSKERCSSPRLTSTAWSAQ